MNRYFEKPGDETVLAEADSMLARIQPEDLGAIYACQAELQKYGDDVSDILLRNVTSKPNLLRLIQPSDIFNEPPDHARHQPSSLHIDLTILIKNHIQEMVFKKIRELGAQGITLKTDLATWPKIADPSAGEITMPDGKTYDMGAPDLRWIGNVKTNDIKTALLRLSLEIDIRVDGILQKKPLQIWIRFSYNPATDKFEATTYITGMPDQLIDSSDDEMWKSDYLEHTWNAEQMMHAMLNGLETTIKHSEKLEKYISTPLA